MDKHWGAGLFTRTWPLVILLFLVNLFLFTTLFTLKDYPYPSLEEAFSQYHEAELLDQANGGLLCSRLVREKGGTISLITVQKHFLADRYALADKSSVNGNYILLDAGMSHLLVNFHSLETINQYQVSTGLPEVPPNALLWSTAFWVIELALWFLFHKIRNS